MTKNFPNWLAAEDSVKSLFQLLGFHVEEISISGRQIDLICSRHDSLNFFPEKWIVEVTTEKVDATKGSKDYQKLMLGKEKYPNARLMIISTEGFTLDQKASLEQLGVVAKTYSEFESTQLNFTTYVENQKKMISENKSNDIGYNPTVYIEPELSVQDSEGNWSSKDAKNWIEETLDNANPQLLAVLGNLGSGKTSLLQKLMIEGCDRFLANKDNSPVPFYLPLGRYKQHSGDIGQMMLSELRKVGVATYPEALIRHLIVNRRIILLLDGLDEIHPIQNSGDVLETVTNILTAVGTDAAAILTCRKQFLETSAEELAYFGPYTAKSLADLQSGLTKKLNSHPTTNIANINPFDRNRVERYLDIRIGMSSEEVSDLFSRFYGFGDLAKTPVLLTMIATTVEEKLIDPASFEVMPLLNLYQVYTNRWLVRDSGRAKLSYQQRMEFSESLAGRMLWESKESVNLGELKEILHSSPMWGKNPLTDGEVELDIRNSGFLVRDLDDRYRFIHRSIMEYFSAITEMSKMKMGERPRPYPSDGYRQFFSQALALEWKNENRVPFPPHSWGEARGDELIDMQLSMLSSACQHFSDADRIEFADIKNAISITSQNWRRILFKSSRWKHKDGVVSFQDCDFENVVIESTGNLKIDFIGCELRDIAIEFIKMPSFAYSVELEGNESSLELSPATWYLCDLLQMRVRASVAKQEWKISRSEMSLLAKAVAKLRGKTYRDNFVNGKDGDRLGVLLERMIKHGWVELDKSRTGHQVSLTSKAFAEVGKLRKQPFEAQRDLLLLFAA